MSKSQIETVPIDLSVILGRANLRTQDLLRMGRGAVIALDAKESDPVWILANGYPIARGDIAIEGDRITVIVTGPADHYDFNAVG